MFSHEERELRQSTVKHLYHLGAIKFGNFTLRHEECTGLCVDMRIVISSPELLQAIATLIWRLRPKFNNSLICGVPYTAQTLVTCLSLKYQIPMVLKRKSPIDAPLVQGIFSPKQTCLVVNDVVASGASSVDTVQALFSQELYVREVLAFLDREQGAAKHLEALGVQLRAVFTLNELIHLLLETRCLSKEDHAIAEQILTTRSVSG